ncbi:response regulator [Vallitaleaceae bacterium 9-2]
MGKYKIFIIDDEPMVIKGLKELVPWEEINCEICGTAKNGVEGLQLIGELKPDIVVSDIRMPKLNGLQMIEKLRAVTKETKFIVLTSYREFDYAQKAIELGVIKYLLKPTNIEDIKSAVIEAMMQLDDERSKEDDVKRLRKKLIETINVFDEEAVEEAVNEPIKKQKDQITSSKEEENESRIKYLAVQAINYMKENYSHKLDLQEVADHLLISTWYLCKILKQELDNSFVQLLNEIRVQEAKRLLVETQYKVYEIGELVGYTDTPYFTKTFKKYTGVTPNQYRNTNYV